MADYATARVGLWGQDVGALAESEAGRITFEYEPGFRATGLEISPIHLPLDRAGPVEFPELARRPAFLGLPGVFADALPDRFGNEIIKRYFEARGRPADAMSPLQRLLYIGDRAMGALTFHPALPSEDSTEEALEVRTLVDQARRIIEGDAPVAVPEIMQVGGSAGGARAKALVLWHRGENRIRSGHARPRPGEEPWLIKFDGVTRDAAGQGMHVDRHPSPWGRIEYTYARMATDAGVEMTETHLLGDGDLGHFMTRRFDRLGGGEKLHMQSLCALAHFDFNAAGAYSYEQALLTIRQLGLSMAAIEEQFRRMVFNILARNQDDHVKNIAFLMDKEGAWSLAPAFDVTYSYNPSGAWTATHQMMVNGKRDQFTVDDLTACAKSANMKRGRAATILDEVRTAVKAWPTFAAEANIPGKLRDQIRRAHRLTM